MLSEKNYLTILKESQSFKNKILEDEISIDNPVVEKYLENVQTEAWQDLGKYISNLGQFFVKKKTSGYMPDVQVSRSDGTMTIKASQYAQAVGATVVVLGAALLVAKLISASYHLYKDTVSKHGKQCNHFKHGSTGRKRCEVMAKMKGMEARIKSLTDAKKYCNKSKDPELCNAKLNAKIRDLQEKLVELKEKFKTTQPVAGQ